MATFEKYITENRHISSVVQQSGKRSVFLVGGTVRDLLLGCEPQDYDFAVSGSGVSFARGFARKIKGAFVLLSQDEDEARVVKDDSVFDFVGLGHASILDDLKRRDFTINAMAVDCDTFELLDPFKGIKDLNKGVVRPVTDTSLRDDTLRILRGYRFSLELDFSLSRNYQKLARGLSLEHIAAERIGYEFLRIMTVPLSYDTLLKMNQLGLFLQIFPEASKIIEDDYLWSHSLGTYRALEQLMQDSYFTRIQPEFTDYFSIMKRSALLKLAGLFHDVAKPDTFLLKEGEVHFYGHDAKGAKIVQTLGYKRLKLSRNDVEMITGLVKEHMRLHLLATSSELTDRAIRRFFRDLGDHWFGAMMIAWADGYATAGWTRHLETVFQRMIALKRADDAKPKVTPLVNGHDLIALGLEPGPKFKVILQEVLDLQLEGKITTKQEGLRVASEINERIEIS